MNLLFDTECAILDKAYQNGLSAFSQANCQCTLTDNGFRIYRPPNLIYPDCGNTVWGGFKLDFLSLAETILFKEHTYVILFNIEGQSSNVASLTWSNQMGWGGGGLSPVPSNISYKKPSANFKGKQLVYYKFTINDDVIKTCTTAYSGFVAGQKYLSYRHFYYGFNYESTGALGTDVYITDLRMYDITDDEGVDVHKNGNVYCNSVIEGGTVCSFSKSGELQVNEIIEL